MRAVDPTAGVWAIAAGLDIKRKKPEAIVALRLTVFACIMRLLRI
jgi:hypothetical protein